MSSYAAVRPIGWTRSDHSNRRAEVRFRAVVIGEPIISRTSELQNYPLSPISPSQSLPFALLPICNTPLIDYTLQTLLNNGVDQVTVLLNSASMLAVTEHLRHNCTAQGKPWFAHDTMKVTTVECTRALTKMADAMNEVRDKNVVPQTSSFLFVPIECVSNFRNLRACFHVHLDRVRTISQYCATLLCTSVEHELRDTLNNVLVQAMGTDLEINSPTEEPMSPLEQSTMHHVGNFNVRVSNRTELSSRHSHLRGEGSPWHVKTTLAHPAEPHTMFVTNQSNNVVTYMAQFKHESDDATEPPLLSFSSSSSSSSSSSRRIRLDLIPTKYLFCTAESLRLMLEDHMSDIYMCLSTGLLGKVDLLGNVFGLIEVGPSVEVATLICPLTSLESYLQCNIDVAARRLAPCTRDSCFAEPQIRYAVVSSLSLLEEYSTVYVHNSVKLSHAHIGPHVVIGPDSNLSFSAHLSGVSCGARCAIGDHSLLVNCVLLDNVTIGHKCTLRNVFIGSNTIIHDNAEISNSIIGFDCVIGNIRASIKDNDRHAVYASTHNTAPYDEHNTNSNNNSKNCNKTKPSTSHLTNTEVHAPIVIHNQAIYSLLPSNKDEMSSNHNTTSDDTVSNVSSGSSSSIYHSDNKDESEELKNDVMVVGLNGKGKVLAHRWSSAISPTSALFADHIPRSTSMNKGRDINNNNNVINNNNKINKKNKKKKNSSNISGHDSASVNRKINKRQSDRQLPSFHNRNDEYNNTISHERSRTNAYNDSGVWEADAQKDKFRLEATAQYNGDNLINKHNRNNQKEEEEEEDFAYGYNTKGVYEEDDEEDEEEEEYDDDYNEYDEDDEDEEDEYDEEEEEEQHDQFRRRITALVNEALLDPKLITVRSFDMGRECVDLEQGYDDMCEIVTELLIAHVLNEYTHDSNTEYSEEEVDKAIDTTRALFAEWCVPFYNNFLSRHDKEMIDAMVKTLSGLCTAISDPSCILHHAAPELVEILYNDCDDDMYDKRGYCIVSGEALLKFDAYNSHQRYLLETHCGIQHGGHNDDNNNNKDASRERDQECNALYDLEDKQEELCLRVAESCHDFIMGVKEFLEQSEGNT